MGQSIVNGEVDEEAAIKLDTMLILRPIHDSCVHMLVMRFNVQLRHWSDWCTIESIKHYNVANKSYFVKALIVN